MADPQTKSRVLRTAEDLFFERGFDEASIAILSSASGVSSGSIYHHFGSKDGVLTALLVEHSTALQQVLLDVLDTHPDDAESGVRHTVAGYLGWTQDNRRAAQLLTEHGQELRTGATRAELRALNDRYLHASGTWLAAQVAAGRLPKFGVEVAHAIVFAPARELCRVWLERDDFPEPTTFTAPLADAAWAGLIATSTDPTKRSTR